MSAIVPFVEDEVKEYLDNAIRSWREILNDRGHPNNEIAVFYCDAFQSVRVSLFGELLPQEEVSK